MGSEIRGAAWATVLEEKQSKSSQVVRIVDGLFFIDLINNLKKIYNLFY